MADKDAEQNPVDQLVDLFVYAPVGLLYEYQEVLPKLVRRGKSQVQIARVIGKLAVNRGNPADTFNELAGGVASILARQVTELGAAIGLAPPEAADDTPPPPDPAGQPPAPQPPPPVPSASPVPTDPPEAAELSEAEQAARQLPIAGYDDLKAKEIITLLDDLEPGQLDRIRAHEEATRARKTVLGKLDRLSK